jgi:hypothetical protein
MQFGTDQYAFYVAFPEAPWRQITYANSIGSFTTRRDGKVIFFNGTSAFIFDTTSILDNATTIKASWRTGKMRLAERGTDLILREIFINKNQVSTVGTLDCKVRLTYDGTEDAAIEFLNVDQEEVRLWLPLGDNVSGLFDYIDIEYNSNASQESGLVEFNEVEIYADEAEKDVLA